MKGGNEATKGSVVTHSPSGEHDDGFFIRFAFGELRNSADKVGS